MEFRYDGNNSVDVINFDTRQTGNFKNKEETEELRKSYLNQMKKLQDKLYSQNTQSLLIILQAMDAAGKDGAIKHVMSGINPQGVEVFNFKEPSQEELDHDYLWRAMRVMPGRGKICIFNRSYYENVLVNRVHKLYLNENLPDRVKNKDIYKDRYKQINNYEQYLYENGIRVIKCFLHISKEEQKKRFLKRIERDEKNWKLSDSDMAEREHWGEYMNAYNDAINATATVNCPWYIVPSDKKWYCRLTISQIIVKTLEEMNPEYPQVTQERKAKLLQFKEKLIRN